MTRCRRLVIRLVLCALALAVSIGIAAALIITKNQQKAAEAAAASEAAARAAEEEAARAAEEEAARAASEAAAQAAQEAENERLAAESAAAKRAEQIATALDARDRIQYGDKLGRIWIEGTDVDCDLYWGDSETQFSRGAGCRSESDCVLPGTRCTVRKAGVLSPVLTRCKGSAVMDLRRYAFS